MASIRRLLRENAALPPEARLSVKDIYERVRDEEGFRGGYSTVSDYVRPIATASDAPEMVELIAAGRQPPDLTAQALRTRPSAVSPDDKSCRNPLCCPSIIE